MGQLYAPLTEEERQQLGVPTGGEGVAVRFVDELIGAYQLLPRPEEGVGEIGWYGLLPQWQGRDQGIQPLGQIIQRCRHMGLLRLRLRCGDDRSGASGKSWAFPRWGAMSWKRTSRHGCWTPTSPCEGQKGEGDPCVARNFCR